MTCIAAIADGDTVWMGGDSGLVTHDSLDITTTPKVFQRGECLIGTSGRLRFCQVVEHRFPPPPMAGVGGAIEAYVIHFTEKMRATLREYSLLKTESGTEQAEGVVLLGFRGRLFYIGHGFEFIENPWGYDAIGTGQDIARGVLYATDVDEWLAPDEPSPPPNVRINMALEAAMQHSVGVLRPFHIMSVKKGDR